MGKSIELKITEAILSSVWEAFTTGFDENYEIVKKWKPGLTPEYYRTAINRLRQSGMVELAKKNGVKFLKLTAKGELRVLVLKAVQDQTKTWDGKWRIIIFDIPESSRDHRNQLRQLLRNNGFYKLQASVFISPYSLNRDAIEYLKQTGLIDFIRILRVDEIDYDEDLKKRFDLK